MKSVKVLLKFAVGEVDKPLTWTFAKEYNIRFSILQADIRSGQGGRLIMDLNGRQEDIENALAFARSQNVGVTVLSRSVRWDEDVCVHCGACTAVCNRKALTLDPATAELRFDNERCTVCEMCIHACPTGAMHVALFS